MGSTVYAYYQNDILLPAAVLTIVYSGRYCDVISDYDVTALIKRIQDRTKKVKNT